MRSVSKPRRHRHICSHPDLFEWADGQGAQQTSAGRWVAKRFSVPAPMAELIAQAAGLMRDR